MRLNYYKHAIEILSKQDVNWRAIVYEIAKDHPKAIVDCFREDWEVPVKEALGLGKVPAIKLYREITGKSLKEAKEAVDKMVEQSRGDG